MSVRDKPVTEWFDGHSRVQTVSLRELICAVKEEAIGLPLFQRGQVWNAEKIAYLWDSLLRGYPIGSFMLVGNQDELQRGEGASWLLLDGQQRYSAISLGYQDQTDPYSNDRPERRLWIDLKHFASGPNEDSKASPFYLTTPSHPWGIQVRVSDAVSKPASENDKRSGREALAAFFKKQEPGDLWFWGEHKEKVKQAREALRWEYPDPWVNMKYTWPVQAQWPVPVSEVITFSLETYGKSTGEGLLESLPRMFPTGFWGDVVGKNATKEEILNACEKLCTQFGKLLDYEVVLIRIPAREENQVAGRSDPEELNEIFQRINRQGASLSEAELFFSTVKLHCKGAHEYVAKVHAGAGKLLQPLEIVHGAARLVRSQPESVQSPESGESLDDLTRLTLGNYKSLVDKGNDDPKAAHFLDQLANYLSDKGPLIEGEAGIRHSLEHLRNALRYAPAFQQGGKDIGLPSPLMASLSWRVWHCMLGWAIRQSEKEVSSNRKDLIRFALLYHFFNDSTAQAGTRHILVDARWHGYEGESFPTKKLASWLHENNYLYAYDTGRREKRAGILTPGGYQDATETSDWILYNDRDLLFWAQRAWMHQWFNDIYDPLHHVRADEKPFDIDHIVPRNWFMNVKKRDKDAFDKAWQIKDSIGNLRIWPRPLNRSEGENAPSARYLIDGVGEQPAPRAYGFWGLNDTSEIPQASSISNEERDYLKDVEKIQETRKDWSSPERCESFVNFSNQRRSRLYKELYDTLGFNELNVDSTD